MKSLIGEMIFGVGISILAGAIVLMWQYLGEIIIDLRWLYLGILMCAGIALIIIGAVKINKFEQINKDTSYPAILFRSKPFLIKIIEFIFVIGSALFFIKFYTLENPSLYSAVIFLISLLLIIIFHKKISHFELSKDKILIKIKEDKERAEEKIRLKQKEWNFEINRRKDNV